MAKEKNALKHRVRLYHLMGDRLLLAFFKKSQAASGPSIWMGDRLGYFERRYSSRESTSMHISEKCQNDWYGHDL